MYLSLINLQTAILLTTTAAACYLTIRYEIRMNHNMILFGLIISFPLAFSLQSAFKAREKAREYLSLFVSSLVSVKESVFQAKKVPDASKMEIRQIVSELHRDFFSCLEKGNPDPSKVMPSFERVSAFMIVHQDEMSSRVTYRVARFMRDVYDSAYYLLSTKSHRSVKGVRLLSTFFVNVFPFVQVPLLFDAIGDFMPTSVIYAVSFLTSITLSAFLLMQKHLNDPFNQNGFDDIKLDVYAIPKQEGRPNLLNTKPKSSPEVIKPASQGTSV